MCVLIFSGLHYNSIKRFLETISPYHCWFLSSCSSRFYEILSVTNIFKVEEENAYTLFILVASAKSIILLLIMFHTYVLNLISKNAKLALLLRLEWRFISQICFSLATHSSFPDRKGMNINAYAFKLTSSSWLWSDILWVICLWWYSWVWKQATIETVDNDGLESISANMNAGAEMKLQTSKRPVQLIRAQTLQRLKSFHLFFILVMLGLCFGELSRLKWIYYYIH